MPEEEEPYSKPYKPFVFEEEEKKEEVTEKPEEEFKGKTITQMLDEAKDKIDVGDYGYAKDIIDNVKEKLKRCVE